MYFRYSLGATREASRLFMDGEDVSLVDDEELKDHLPKVIVDMDVLYGMESFEAQNACFCKDLWNNRR